MKGEQCLKIGKQTDSVPHTGFSAEFYCHGQTPSIVHCRALKPEIMDSRTWGKAPLELRHPWAHSCGCVGRLWGPDKPAPFWAYIMLGCGQSETNAFSSDYHIDTFSTIILMTSVTTRWAALPTHIKKFVIGSSKKLSLRLNSAIKKLYEGRT